jgi:AcrR family transcriptional regulator
MVRQVVARNRERVREHRRANEQAIVDATKSLLGTGAYRDLSIEDVMTAAGLTRTAFYRYFPDLEAVLLHLVEDIADELDTATQWWLEADPANGRAALVKAGLKLAETYRSHGRVLAALADAAAISPDMDLAWRDVIGRFIEPNTNRLVDLCARGVCALAHPEQTARALVWMTDRYLLETYGRDSAVPTRVAAETLAEIWHRTVFSNVAPTTLT